MSSNESRPKVSDGQNSQISESKTQKKKSKNAYKEKLKTYKGDAYEKFTFFTLCNKIYAEDQKKSNCDDINSNTEIKLDDIIVDIIKIGLKFCQNDEQTFLNIQSQLYNYYRVMMNYNINFGQILNEYETSSGYDTETSQKNRKKTIKDIEFDLILKDIEGKKVQNYLDNLKDNNYLYINSFDILNEQKYNLCFEITTSSKDVESKKIPQILKYAIWLNFLYNINSVFSELLEKSKQNKSENKSISKDLLEMLNQFEKKFKYINFKNKTLLFIISNGEKSEFEKLKNFTKPNNENNIKLIKELDKECRNKYNLYFNYLPFNIMEIKEEIKNNIAEIKVDKPVINNESEEYKKKILELENKMRELENKIKILEGNSNEKSTSKTAESKKKE